VRRQQALQLVHARLHVLRVLPAAAQRVHARQQLLLRGRQLLQLAV
jgi:hypothetical protein